MRSLVAGLFVWLALVPAALADDGIALRTSMTPRVHLFGDPVTAQVDLVVPAKDAAAVRVLPDFRPYERVGPVRITRVGAGQRVGLRYRYTLDCLQSACLPRAAGRPIVLTPVRVAIGASRISAPWGPLVVRSRLAPGDVENQRIRACVHPVGPVGYRISPGILFGLLVGAAALLVAVALALVARAAGAQWLVLRRRRFTRLGAVERALVLVRLAARGDEERRRRALERLGRELEADGKPQLGRAASRLAWDEDPPDEASVLALAGRVERELEPPS